MRTAWKAIPTLSRTCAHCCSGLSAAHCSAYAQQELNELESLTDAPVRPLGSSRTARTLKSGRRSSVPCFAGCAPCERGSADAGYAVDILRLADHDRRPVTEHQQWFGTLRRCIS